MTTVIEYIGNNAARGAEMVAEGYRLSEVNDATPVEDAICDLLHLLEEVYDINGYDGDSCPDPRAAVLAGLERAIGHYWSESVFAIEGGEEPSDILGGIPIYAIALDTPHLTDH